MSHNHHHHPMIESSALDSSDDALDFEVVVEVGEHQLSNFPNDGEKKTSRTTYQLIRIVKASRSKNDKNNNDKQQQVQTWINDAATMMLYHWPNGGPIKNYHDKIMSSVASATKSNEDDQDEHEDHHHHHSLPCSYLLLENNKSESIATCGCIGHARLTECFQGAGGNAVAATYVIIHPNYRSGGKGKILMKLLEKHILQNFKQYYHYLYLWTQTAIRFYMKCGYQHCQRVSIRRECLKSLSTTQVTSIESLLLSKIQQKQPKVTNNGVGGGSSTTNVFTSTETIMLPPSSSSSNSKKNEGNRNDVGDDDNGGDEDVWLCKRLVEQIPQIPQLEVQPRINQIHQAILQNIQKVRRSQQLLSETHAKDSQNGGSSHSHYTANYVFIDNVPWEQQIGPSCGLAALRMVRGYYDKLQQEQRAEQKTDDADAAADDNDLTMLQYAIQHGYTVDGEMWNIQQLQSVANEYSNMNTQLKSFSSSSATVDSSSTTQITPNDMFHNMTCNNDMLSIIPYDSHPRTKLPCSTYGGHHAHYGIIVGMVIINLNDIDNNDDDDDNVDEEDGHDDCFQDIDDVGSFQITYRRKLLKCDDDRRRHNTTNNDNKQVQNGIKNMNNNCENVLVLVQHSLSQELCISSWKDFIESNQQLNQVDEDKYQVPSTSMSRQFGANVGDDDDNLDEKDKNMHDNATTTNNNTNKKIEKLIDLLDLKDRILMFSGLYGSQE